MSSDMLVLDRIAAQQCNFLTYSLTTFSSQTLYTVYSMPSLGYGDIFVCMSKPRAVTDVTFSQLFCLWVYQPEYTWGLNEIVREQ